MTNQFAKYHDAALHTFGVVCPSLCMVLLFEHGGILIWIWMLFLWMACGHFILYLYEVYPRLKYNPFATGLFAFGVGVLWPVWLKRHMPRKGAWGQWR
jgi:hypothetical protein